MTTEDKAREMLARYAGPAKDGYTQPYWRQDLAGAIAAALRAARNEALEDAAKVAQKYAADQPPSSLRERSACHAVASAIRSLKQGEKE